VIPPSRPPRRRPRPESLAALLTGLLLLPVTAAWGGPELTVPQGGVGRVEVTIEPGDSAPWGSFRGQTVYFRSEGGRRFAALVGVDMESPTGPQPMNVMVIRDGVTRRIARPTVEVVPGDFGMQRLTLPDQMVNLSPPTLARVKREKAQVADLWASGGRRPLWREAWGMPVAGEPSGSFGKRRVINGQPRSPHNGEDIPAPAGTAVRAPNDGIARLAGERYFGGRTVFLEHGGDLFTFYMHLSEIAVSDGQRVRKGDVIGRVGQSGRATGPHLHWGGRLNNARINPLALVRPEPTLALEEAQAPGARGPEAEAAAGAGAGG
jgi:hypothetical protein